MPPRGSAARGIPNGQRLATVRHMEWPKVARVADLVVVTALVVSGQVSVWTADTGALAADRPAHAVLLAVATVPLYVRRQRPLLSCSSSSVRPGCSTSSAGCVRAVVLPSARALRRRRGNADQRAAVTGAHHRGCRAVRRHPEAARRGPDRRGAARLVRPRRHLGPRPVHAVTAAETADLADRASRAERDRAEHARGPSPTNGRASPASCTTWSRTAWA